MKTRKQPPAKLPKGRVLYGSIRPKGGGARCTEYFQPEPFDHYDTPFAVLPAHTKAQARQMVKAHKFLAMTREEQEEAIQQAMHNEMARWAGGDMQDKLDTPRAVLATIYGEAKP